jgi:hypothetical protein
MRSLLVLSGLLLFTVVLSEAFTFQRIGSTSDTDVHRTLKVVATDNRLDIIAVRTDLKKSQKADAIEFVFGTNWLPRFVLRYFHRDSDSADVLAGRWALWKIVEYVDNTTEAGFDPTVDTIVSESRLWTASKFFNLIVVLTFYRLVHNL